MRTCWGKHQHHKLEFIPLTKTTTVQNEIALSYQRVRGLYFLAVVFAATIDLLRALEAYGVLSMAF